MQKQRTLITERQTIPCKAPNPKEIWGEMIQHNETDIKQLYRAMKAITCRKISTPAFNTLSWLLYQLVYKNHGRYSNESDYMATQTGVLSPAQAAFLQRQFTLAHAAFCTTTTAWDEEHQEMVCMRSLDWQGADAIAQTSRIFDFTNLQSQTIATVAGIAGMTGVLTGVKHGFSIAGNYAPWAFSARFRNDPTFLIRDILQDEAIDTYAKAVTAIKEWQVGSPCFITVCGVKKGEASVLEFGKGTQVCQTKADPSGVLVQANHYSCNTFKPHSKPQYKHEPEGGWYDSSLLRNSEHRQQQVLDGLQADSSAPLEATLKQLYAQPPVLNYETAQWVLMRPARTIREERMKLWKWTT